MSQEHQSDDLSKVVNVVSEEKKNQIPDKFQQDFDNCQTCKRQQPDPNSKKSQRKRKQALRDKTQNFCLEYLRTAQCTRENCNFNHNVNEFLAGQTDLKEGVCPIYEKHGKCTSGYSCSWNKSHMTEDCQLIVDEQKLQEHPIASPLNSVTGKFLHQLRTNKYTFNLPDQYPEPQPMKLDMKDKLIFPSLCTFGNLPYRKIVKRFGCDVTMTEMAMAEQLIEGKTSEWALLKRDPSEDIFGAQICVGDAVKAAKVTSLLNQFDFDFYEINCACPIDLVYNKGMGAQLIERPKRIQTLLAAMRAMTDRAVCLKCRTGKTENTIDTTLLPFVGKFGAANVSIHGRTRNQRYTKTADWDFLKTASSVCPVPVIGVGDIYTYEDFIKAKECGVNSVAIGRGSLMKPWIFKEIKENKHWDISSSERLDIIKEYALNGLLHWGSDKKGIETTREFLCHHLTFMSRYVPVHCLIDKNEKPSLKSRHASDCCYRDDLEKLLASDKNSDLVKISEMFLGPAPKDFVYVPKHKSYTSD